MKTGLPRHMTVSDWPWLDRGDVDLDRGERQRRGVGVHLVDEGPERGRDADGGESAGRDDQKVAARDVGADLVRVDALGAGRGGDGMGRISQILPLALERRVSIAADGRKRRHEGQPAVTPEHRPCRRSPFVIVLRECPVGRPGDGNLSQAGSTAFRPSGPFAIARVHEAHLTRRSTCLGASLALRYNSPASWETCRERPPGWQRGRHRDRRRLSR